MFPYFGHIPKNYFVKIKIEEIILGVKISKTDKSLVKKLVSRVLPNVRITELKSNLIKL